MVGYGGGHLVPERFAPAQSEAVECHDLWLVRAVHIVDRDRGVVL
jgi:hypothetical protein